MTRRGDLLQQLASLVTDLPPALPPDEPMQQLRAVCITARLAFGAAAVSVAALDDDTLDYLAADGEGAEIIAGTRLPVTRGIAGYAALSGQSLAVDRATDDPRFARDVAERTGYVPTSMLVVPISGGNGVVLGVLSVLDRRLAGSDALVLASAFADHLALILPVVRDVGRVSTLLLEAIADGVAHGDAAIADALRRVLAARPETDPELVRIASTLGQLRLSDEQTRARVGSLLDDIVALATTKRRR